STGEASTFEFDQVPLPTTTTTTTTTIAPPPTTAPEPGAEPGGPLIDPSTFGTERPTGIVGGVLFDLLTDEAVLGDEAVAPNVANCAIETLFTRTTEEDLLAAGIATLEPAALEPV